MGAEVLAMTLLLTVPPRATAAEPAATVQPVDVRTVTLAEVLERARIHGPAVVRAEARLELGQAQRAAASPLLPDNPSVYLGVGGRINPLGFNVELQAQVSQPLEIAGERRMRLDAAAAYQGALAQRHALVRWQAEVEARAAFHHALVERRRTETAALAEEFSRSVVNATEVLVSAGEESPLRLRLAQAELAQAQQTRQAAEQRYRAACSRLAELVGWPPDQALRPRGELPKPRSAARMTTAAHTGGEGPSNVHEHPAVVAVQAEVEAAEAELAAARRDAWPHPSVGVYLAREREPGTPVTSRVALATVSIPLPLWQRNQGDKARARARLRIASTERAVVARQLTRERVRAQDAFETAARRLETYAADVLPRLSENLVLLRRAFELGEIDLLEVFVARERFLRLQHEALDVYADYIEAERDLALASG